MIIRTLDPYKDKALYISSKDLEDFAASGHPNDIRILLGLLTAGGMYKSIVSKYRTAYITLFGGQVRHLYLRLSPTVTASLLKVSPFLVEGVYFYALITIKDNRLRAIFGLGRLFRISRSCKHRHVNAFLTRCMLASKKSVIGSNTMERIKKFYARFNLPEDSREPTRLELQLFSPNSPL